MIFFLTFISIKLLPPQRFNLLFAIYWQVSRFFFHSLIPPFKLNKWRLKSSQPYIFLLGNFPKLKNRFLIESINNTDGFISKYCEFYVQRRKPIDWLEANYKVTNSLKGLNCRLNIDITSLSEINIIFFNQSSTFSLSPAKPPLCSSDTIGFFLICHFFFFFLKLMTR